MLEFYTCLKGSGLGSGCLLLASDRLDLKVRSRPWFPPT